jgi:hypothetical protein
VPALKTAGQSLTVAQLTHIINHGLGESANPKQPYMPVWGEVISKTQVSDLVAYLRAGLPRSRDTSRSQVPAGQGAAVAGSALYVRYGLHQLSTAPTARRRAEPALRGQDDPYRSRAATSAASSTPTRRSRPVIRSGSVIGKAPIVSMPHWGGNPLDQQIAELTAYLKTLK